jgi:hypothetical protein
MTLLTYLQSLELSELEEEDMPMILIAINFQIRAS